MGDPAIVFVLSEWMSHQTAENSLFFTEARFRRQ